MIVQKGEKHLTASAWIITSTKPKKVLLVHHKKFNKWIQPGGHVDFGENPIESVVRETREETGIDISVLLEIIKPASHDSKLLPIPDYFLEEEILPYKDQPAHFHLDCQFIIKVKEQVVQRRKEESYGIQWFTFEEIRGIIMHDNTRSILEKLLA